MIFYLFNLSEGSNEKGFNIGKDMLCPKQIWQSVSIIQGDNRSPSFNVLRFCGFVTVDLLNYMSNFKYQLDFLAHYMYLSRAYVNLIKDASLIVYQHLVEDM